MVLGHGAAQQCAQHTDGTLLPDTLLWARWEYARTASEVPATTGVPSHNTAVGDTPGTPPNTKDGHAQLCKALSMSRTVPMK